MAAMLVSQSDRVASPCRHVVPREPKITLDSNRADNLMVECRDGGALMTTFGGGDIGDTHLHVSEEYSCTNLAWWSLVRGTEFWRNRKTHH